MRKFTCEIGDYEQFLSYPGVHFEIKSFDGVPNLVAYPWDGDRTVEGAPWDDEESEVFWPLNLTDVRDLIHELQEALAIMEEGE